MDHEARDAARRWEREARRALPTADDDLIEEVSQHIADSWRRAVALGASPAAADAQARRDLATWASNPLPRRRSRLSAAAAWCGLGADVKRAARVFRLRPIFSVGAALLSAIAVTGVACAFAVVYGILWRPLPYPEPSRLTVLWETRQGQPSQISYPDFTDVSGASVFDAASAIGGGRANLRVGDAILRVNMLSMEPAGYEMLGARPHVGRLLLPADADQPVAMISHRLWVTALGSDPAVVGRQLWLSGQDFRVVGVLQPGFDFELPVAPYFRLEKNDIWTVFPRRSPMRARRDVSTYQALARLAPGRSLDDAQAAADAIAARLATAHPATNAGRGFRVASLASDIAAPARRPLMFVALGAAVTLLVALANLAVLGLVRTSERQPELAIRSALGASGFRLWRQTFSENLLVAVAGGVVGGVGADAVLGWILSSEAAALPRRDAIRFDPLAWVVAAVVVVVVAAVLTWQPGRSRSTALRSGERALGRTVRRSRRLIVAAEVGLALVLASASAVLTLSLVRLLDVDPGFDGSRSGAARVAAYAARYPTRDSVTQFFDTLLTTLRASPQVEIAGAGSSLPLSGQMSGSGVVAEGRPITAESRLRAGWQVITPGYLAAVGMRLREGRDFTEADRGSGRHLTIITEDLARILFPGQSAIGRRIGVGGGEAANDWHEVVGVVESIRHTALDRAPEPRVYDLFGPHWERGLFVAIRTRAPDPALVPAQLRAAVRSLDPEAPVFEAATLPELTARSAGARRLASLLALGLAAAGVLLALIGTYSVVAASVSERTREIGVRAALGAAPRDLFRLVALEGAWSAAAGGLGGLLASAAVVRLLQAHVFGVGWQDAVWLIPGVLAAVIAAILCATIAPARRAAAADPLIAMRAD